MKKRLLLLGFVIIMLITIPLIVFIAGKQTKTRTKAEQATRLSFVVPPDPISVGQTFTLDINLDPGNVNQVSFVKLVISYNSQKLKRVELKKNDALFQVTLEGPTYDKCPSANTCTMTIAMAIDPNTGKPIQGGSTVIGSATFQALQSTDNGPTTVSFDSGTQVLSLASGDAPSENVLVPSGSTPASITIGAVPTGSPTPTGNVTDTPTPTGSGTITPTGTGTSGNKPPVCTSFTADSTSGNPPLTVNFGIAGTDSDGTISKVSLNFGDGAVQDLTSDGGIGTANVSTSAAHIYSANGTFTATATMTDDQNGISNPTSCSQTITVGASATITATPTPQLLAATSPTPSTLPPTGPGQVVVGAGVMGAVFSALGALLIFGL